MSEIKIQIDYRETKIIELLKVPFETCNLPIGDIIFKNGEEIEYIIERKTIGDLVSSICDGRYAEQKDRLKESVNGDNQKIVYLLEGNKRIKSKIGANVINGAILNLIFNCS